MLSQDPFEAVALIFMTGAILFLVHYFIKVEFEGYKNALKVIGVFVVLAVLAGAFAGIEYILKIPAPIMVR